MEFLETSVFTRQILALLNEDEYRKFQNQLSKNPTLGPVIKGGNGIRKVRVAVDSRGKRGGARVIYYWVRQRERIVLLYAYTKNEADTLTEKQTRQLAKLVEEEFGNEG